MDEKTFAHLCALSKLDYTEEEKQRTMKEMDDIITLMDTVKGFTLDYDDKADGNEIAYADLREDIRQESYPPERLLQNTAAVNNSYVIPKLID